MSDSLQDSPNPLQRLARRIIAVPAVTGVLSWTIHRLDGPILRGSQGRYSASSLITGLPIIALTTTGARSGLPRTVPLVGLPLGDGRLAVIASNWGQTKHPAWYHNVRANPAVSVARRGRMRPFTAREAAGEEREALWRKAVALYPGYAAYAERCGGRVIPVIVLEAAAEA